MKKYKLKKMIEDGKIDLTILKDNTKDISFNRLDSAATSTENWLHSKPAWVTYFIAIFIIVVIIGFILFLIYRLLKGIVY